VGAIQPTVTLVEVTFENVGVPGGFVSVVTLLSGE
jgi:hypothetical protein